MNTTVFDKDWVELVFEGRNQNYGAYVIRKNQGNNMLWGVFITLGIGVVAIAVPRIIMALSDAPIVEVIIPDCGFHEFKEIVFEDIIPPTTQPAVAPKATKVDAPLKIVVDKDVKKVLPPILPTTLPPENGNVNAGNVTGTGLLPSTGGGGVVPIIEPPVVIEPPSSYAEIMPEFIGGETQLFKYLGSKIIYPSVAKDNNIGGKVFLTFVVETDGSISNVTLLGGIKGAPDLAQEAMRVVKAMPNWKPGKQNGKPVRVQFNLPVVFSLN